MPVMPISKVIDKEKSRVNEDILQFPEDIGMHGLLMVFKKYSFNKRQSGLLDGMPEIRLGNSIFLPLPTNIQDTYNVRVQRMDQGTIGEATSAAASAFQGSEGLEASFSASQSVLRDLAPSGQATAESVGDILREITGREQSGALQDMTRAASFLMRSTLDRLNVTQSFDAGIGSTINPKAALTFEGIEMKEHSFEWSLMPRSKRESESLRRIEHVIKQNTLPSYINIGEIQRALYNYPSMVDLYFVGLDPSYFVEFKTCMVQNFSINYTPEGLAVMKGGKPAAVNFSMQLIETDIHTSEDYGGGESTSLPLSGGGGGDIPNRGGR